MSKIAPAVWMLVSTLAAGGTLADASLQQIRGELKPVWPEIVEGFDPDVATAVKHPPAKPGAFECEPLKAAMRGR